MDLHIPTFRKWDQIKKVFRPFIFIVVICTNVGGPWAWLTILTSKIDGLAFMCPKKCNLCSRIFKKSIFLQWDKLLMFDFHNTNIYAP
jgi:hypothetical protein